LFLSRHGFILEVLEDLRDTRLKEWEGKHPQFRKGCAFLAGAMMAAKVSLRYSMTLAAACREALVYMSILLVLNSREATEELLFQAYNLARVLCMMMLGLSGVQRCRV
jgi:hypothetical protein